MSHSLELLYLMESRCITIHETEYDELRRAVNVLDLESDRIRVKCEREKSETTKVSNYTVKRMLDSIDTIRKVLNLK